jgi:hypothetical protein
METLKRYRSGGEQKVTVRHELVSEEGQAIVRTFLKHGQYTREALAELKLLRNVFRQSRELLQRMK